MSYVTRVNSRLARRCAFLVAKFRIRQVLHIREEIAGLAVVLLYRNVRILSALTGIASMSVVLDTPGTRSPLKSVSLIHSSGRHVEEILAAVSQSELDVTETDGNF